jgi:hypothetical protein
MFKKHTRNKFLAIGLFVKPNIKWLPIYLYPLGNEYIHIDFNIVRQHKSVIYSKKRIKKSPTIKLLGFLYMVAGAGFEPTTFGL